MTVLHARPRATLRTRLLAVALGALTLAGLTTVPAHASGWSLVKYEGFGTDAAAGTVDKAYPDSIESYYWGIYHTSQESTHGGVLDVLLKDNKGAGFVLGPASNRWGRQYGRFTIRFKAQNAGGYGTAMMLWPSDRSGCPNGGCWSDGEIDFIEGRLSSTMAVHHHPMNCVDGGSSTKPDCYSADSLDLGAIFTDAYHTATVEWTPSGVRYYLDGTLRKTVTHDVPTVNHRMTVQLGPELSNPQAGHFYIDYYKIEAYQP